MARTVRGQKHSLFTRRDTIHRVPYAVGHVARSYYSAGRKLEPDTLKRMFSEHVERGKALFASHQPAVEASARTTDVGSLLQMVRG